MHPIYQFTKAFYLVLNENSDTKVKSFRVVMKPVGSVRNKGYKLSLQETFCRNSDENTL